MLGATDLTFGTGYSLISSGISAGVVNSSQPKISYKGTAIAKERQLKLK